MRPSSSALSQVWVFLVAPMVGGILAAVLHFLVHPMPAGLVFGRKRLGKQPADDAPRPRLTRTTRRYPHVAAWLLPANPASQQTCVPLRCVAAELSEAADSLSNIAPKATTPVRPQ
jgi:hypothetical protein